MADEKKNATEFYTPPPQMSKWESFKLFLYDKEKGEVMGRTGLSWAKVGLFYLIFYAALAAFFAVMLVIFYQTLNTYEPRWKLDSSLIGTNPGLGFRPMPDNKSNVESTLIWFQHGSNGSWKPWVDRLQESLEPYEEGKQYGQTIQKCSWNSPPQKDKVCYFDIKSFGDNCTKERNFGYDQGHPCILIKINRIFDWEPVAYEGTDVPEDMPQDLKNEIAKNTEGPKIWLSCEGENPADRENIGPLVYSPSQGYPTYYYPFKNTPHYMSPLIMVQLLKPVPGVLINIECRAWAKNIEHNRMERRGSVHFELLMD